MKNDMLKNVAGLLLVVGGVNWGLVGFFNYNLVSSLLGDGSFLANLVYDLVGLSALYMAWGMWGAKK